MTPDDIEATHTLATANQQLDQYRRDFETMSERCVVLAGQLTAMERRYDLVLLHLRAVVRAAAVALDDRRADTMDSLVTAIEAALAVIPEAT